VYENAHFLLVIFWRQTICCLLRLLIISDASMRFSNAIQSSVVVRHHSSSHIFIQRCFLQAYSTHSLNRERKIQQLAIPKTAARFSSPVFADDGSANIISTFDINPFLIDINNFYYKNL
jgi:hypothetical protein